MASASAQTYESEITELNLKANKIRERISERGKKLEVLKAEQQRLTPRAGNPPSEVSIANAREISVLEADNDKDRDLLRPYEIKIGELSDARMGLIARQEADARWQRGEAQITPLVAKLIEFQFGLAGFDNVRAECSEAEGRRLVEEFFERYAAALASSGFKLPFHRLVQDPIFPDRKTPLLAIEITVKSMTPPKR